MIVVMGHGKCGGIHAALDTAKSGRVPLQFSSIVRPLWPAARDAISPNPRWSVSHAHDGDEWWRAVETNVQMNAQGLVQGEGTIGEMARSGELAVAGAVFNLETSEVEPTGADFMGRIAAPSPRRSGSAMAARRRTVSDRGVLT